MSTKQPLPVVPYAIATVTHAAISRVTLQANCCVHNALVDALAELRYIIVKAEPSSVPGLETITAEKVMDGMPCPPSIPESIQRELAARIRAVWNRVQWEVPRDLQNPAHMA